MNESESTTTELETDGVSASQSSLESSFYREGIVTRSGNRVKLPEKAREANI